MTTDHGCAPTVVRRDITLDLDHDDAWALLGDSEGWERWLVDEAALDVAPGAAGTVSDDGEEREVAVTAVEPGRAVTFDWWPPGDPEGASRVSLTIDEDDGGAVVLRVVESFPAPIVMQAALRWEVRAAAAWAAGLARALV